MKTRYLQYALTVYFVVYNTICILLVGFFTTNNSTLFYLFYFQLKIIRDAVVMICVWLEKFLKGSSIIILLLLIFSMLAFIVLGQPKTSMSSLIELVPVYLLCYLDEEIKKQKRDQMTLRRETLVQKLSTSVSYNFEPLSSLV